MSGYRIAWGIAAVMATATVIAAVVPHRAAAEGNVRNGLSSLAFRRNALTTNRASLAHVRLHPLDDKLFTDPEFAFQMHDERAQAVMTEMVRCALGPETIVRFLDPRGHEQHAWRGELGLCQGSANDAGNWHTAAPTPLCQELVTACLAARVNALHKSVPVSLRGEPASLFPVLAAIRSESRYREAVPGTDPAVGVAIGSFRRLPCPVGADCNWRPAFVGRCDGGSRVSLAITDPAACEIPMRVCSGIHGCVGAQASWTQDFAKPAYSSVIAEQASACERDPMDFICPSEEQYSVMVRGLAAKGEASLARPPEVTELSGGGGYPASESEVFGFREGAFFGNLFDPEALTRECKLTPTSPRRPQCVSLDGSPIPPCTPTTTHACDDPERTLPYRKLYACYSAEQEATSTDDSLSAAYFNDRICSEPDPEHPCFSHPPERCDAHCGWDETRGVYRECTGTDGKSRTTYHPVTTYLEQPCDLLGDPALCERARAAAKRWEPPTAAATTGGGGVPEVTPSSHGCGCATAGGDGSGGGGGMLAQLLLGAAVAVGLRKRRRRGLD